MVPTVILTWIRKGLKRTKWFTVIFEIITFPDPPTLAFLEKARVFPPKSKGFSLRGTPTILGKERKNAPKKQGRSENEKSKEIEKSKGWRVRVSNSKTFQDGNGNGNFEAINSNDFLGGNWPMEIKGRLRGPRR